MTQVPKRIWVCTTGPNCTSLAAQPQKVLEALQAAIAIRQAGDRLEALGTGCLGMCGLGPNARVKCGRSASAAYCRLEPEDAAPIVDAHLKGDSPWADKLLKRT